MQLKSKKDAAELLGVSTRAIERAVRRGHLVAQYRPSKHGRMAWFAAHDLARYRELQQSRTAFGFASVGFTSAAMKPPVDAAFTVGTITPLAPAEDERHRQPQHRHEPTANIVPLNQRLTLSLAEAAQLAGLPRHFLLENIEAKKLKAVRIGRLLYLKRSELEAFVAGL